jgi:hypothetical protein
MLPDHVTLHESMIICSFIVQNRIRFSCGRLSIHHNACENMHAVSKGRGYMSSFLSVYNDLPI